jgi:acetolactate synthase-1/2/3 large subunit
MRLVDAMASSGLEYIPARSETAACMMAGADAQLNGTLGVVVVTLAPGLTNAINGIANALLDGIPLLVISGQHPRDRLPVMVRQTLDNHQVVAGVVKWSGTAGTRIHQVLARAIRTARLPPAGPVYLEISDEVASGDVEDELDTWARPLQRDAHDGAGVDTGYRAGPVDEVRARLGTARRPAMIVGGFEWSEGELQALVAFADAVGCVVFTTPSAKGSMPHDHVRYAGTFYNGNLERQLLDASDALIMVNVQANDILHRPWP